MPPRVELSVVPASVHVPDWSDHVTEPLDCPPVVVSASVEPVVNEESFVMENPVWAALSTVMVVFDDCFTSQLVSWAFVARTTQVEPASPGVSVDETTVQVLPVAGTTTHVTAPVPEPPEVVRASVWP